MFLFLVSYCVRFFIHANWWEKTPTNSGNFMAIEKLWGLFHCGLVAVKAELSFSFISWSPIWSMTNVFFTISPSCCYVQNVEKTNASPVLIWQPQNLLFYDLSQNPCLNQMRSPAATYLFVILALLLLLRSRCAQSDFAGRLLTQWSLFPPALFRVNILCTLQGSMWYTDGRRMKKLEEAGRHVAYIHLSNTPSLPTSYGWNIP